MWNYTDKVMDHFLNPRNVGEIKNADATAEVGNMTCGDALRIFLKIKDDKIEDVKFKTFGCASAIASSSVLTEIVKGMTLDEAEKVTNREIADKLGGLPEEKMHCSVMGMEALQAAIADYRRKHGEKVAETDGVNDHEGRIVCKCFGVTDVKIRRVAKQNNLHTVEEVTKYTKAGGGCGACLDQIQQILDALWKEKAPETPSSDKKDNFDSLSVVQKVIRIQSVIDKEIRPILEHDGGDIDLIDIDGDTAIVRMKGHCSGCMASKVTLKNLVQAKLNEFVSDKIRVREAE